MCALSPLFPMCDWPLDSPINHESVEDDFLHSNPTTLPPHSPAVVPSSSRARSLTTTPVSGIDEGRLTICTPLSVHCFHHLSKRLSIPATVSRVLAYIPELQAQLERLVQKKEEILSRIITSQDDEFIHRRRQNKSKDRLSGGSGSGTTSPSAVYSVTRIGKREVVVQISALIQALETYPLSHMLLDLEEDGLFLTDASCFESFGGRVFYNLHFQVEETCNLEGVALNEKLSSLYGNGN